MKKFALITALAMTSTLAVPAMADNGNRYKHNGATVHRDASSHKYVKYNNGNAYSTYKHKTKKAPAKSARYQHTNLKKWPVPTTPNNSPNHHRDIIGQHH